MHIRIRHHSRWFGCVPYSATRRRTPGLLRASGLLSGGRHGCLSRLLRLLPRFLGNCFLRRRFLCDGCLRLLSFGLFQCPTFFRGFADRLPASLTQFSLLLGRSEEQTSEI